MNKTLSSNSVQPQSQSASRKPRGRAMLWSFLFIVLSAMILPTASYLVPAEPAFAQSSDEIVIPGTESDGVNNRANFWRAVREGNAGYSAVKGPETGVFINNGGQNWRQLRNKVVNAWGGWGILGALGLIIIFFLVRGRIKVDGEESGLTVPRWKGWERFMHWYTAILFVVLAITGLSMLFGRTVLIPLLGASGFSVWANLSINVHNYVGPFFSIGVFAMLLFWVHNNIPTSVDVKWLLKGGGIIGNAHPSAGKANGGEKVWFWIVIFVGLLAVCGSGFVLIGWMADWGLAADTRRTMQTANLVHAVSAIIWIMVFFGHAYIGSLGTEGALQGMTKGRVSVEWAKQHHDLWYEEVKDQAERVDQPTSSAEPSTSTS